MSPRTRSILASGGTLLVLVLALQFLPMPYVVESPGPTLDVYGEWDGRAVIAISGVESYPPSGRLDLTTVTQTRADSRLDLATAYGAWLDRDRIVLPRRLVYPPGTTAEDSKEQNDLLLDRSQEAARAAALRHLGYEVPRRVVVERIIDEGPSVGRLRVGDVILAAGGMPVSTPDDVRVAIRRLTPGDEIEMTVERDGRQRVISIPTGSLQDDPGVAFVGIVPAPGYDFPEDLDIDIQISERIGGPSAGIIFAIGIVDTMTPGGLLGDLHLAGTGTIDDQGAIGAIGGIQQKIAAARRVGAAAFLVPEPNCKDVIGARPGDMRLIKVSALEDALSSLSTLAKDSQADLPTC